MKDPARLSDGACGSTGVALLAAVRGISAPEGACDRALGNLRLGAGGLATAALVTTQNVRAAASHSALPTASAGAASKAGVASGLLWKAAVTSVLLGAASLTLGRGGTETALSPARSAPRAVLPSRDATSVPAVVPLAPPAPSTPAAPVRSRAAEPKVDSRPPRATAPFAHASELSLSAQLALLDEARRAAPQRALALLVTYRDQYPQGALSYEASLLRVDTLERLGRHAEALPLARMLLRTYPNGTASPRLKQLVAQ